MSAFSVLDFKTNASISKADREEKLDILLDHYGKDRDGVSAMLEPNKCRLEMQLLVPLVKNNYSVFQPYNARIVECHCRSVLR